MLRGLKTKGYRAYNWLLHLLYATPPRYRAGLFANFIGLQILRTLVFEFGYRLRKIAFRRTNITSEALEHDGISVFEDFLSHEQMKELEFEATQFLDNSTVTTDARPLTLTCNLHLIAKNGYRLVSKTFSREFFEKSGLYDIVECFLKKRVRIPPRVYFIKQQYHTKDLGLPQQDYQDEPHFDIPFRSVKAILYIGDTDDSNGAFNYARGSNRFTLQRLLGEYLHSIMSSKNKKTHRNPLQGLKLSRFRAESLGSVPGKKNTLIIFDARGVHRRGDFKTDHPRETIFIDFRDTDSWMNSIMAAPIMPRQLKKFGR